MRYRKRIKPNWHSLLYIQDDLARKLRKHEKSYIDDIVMITGELLENAVKYYMKREIDKSINFYFSNKDGVTVSIRNQYIDKSDIKSITDFIDNVNCSDPDELYVNRLQEISDRRVEGESRFGLIRIGCTHDFVLGYELNSDQITIYAKKRVAGEEKDMESLEHDELKIDIIKKDNRVDVIWAGKCRCLNPEQVLDKYLAAVSEFAKDKEVVVTFDKLEAMNSSTVPPILTFMKSLNDNSTKSLFLYDSKEDWQRASFKPLSVIVAKYKNIEIKSI